MNKVYLVVGHSGSSFNQQSSCKLIKPHIPDTFLLKSTSMFVDMLNGFDFDDGDKLVSFDVVSLFTNVPLAETIKIITSYVYSPTNKDVPPYSKTVFKNMLELATAGVFAYKDKLYKQKDGVTMGSPLGPTLANFFLGHLEKKLRTSDVELPRLYLRYIDDIFAVFPNDTDFQPFFDKLNALHPNLKFTTEIGGQRLAFLDTDIAISGSDLEISIFRKPTNTDVVLNWTACCPLQWKQGLMYCFLHRAWTICSSYAILHSEWDKLKSIFVRNGYPVSIFDKCLKAFLNRKFVKSQRGEIDDEPERMFVLQIPYVGKASLLFRRKMVKLVDEIYGRRLRCIFTSCKVKNYFSLKCKTNSFLAAHVVYQFCCQRDAEVSYIGETKRHLGIRVDEHLKGKFSAVGDHLRECETCQDKLSTGELDYRNFKVIKSGTTKFDVQILEALLIKKHAPSLNKQIHFDGTAFTLRIFS